MAILVELGTILVLKKCNDQTAEPCTDATAVI